MNPTGNAPQPMSIAMDLEAGRLQTGEPTQRHLSDLRGFFADEAAYEAALSRGDALVYTVSAVQPGSGAGDLHAGLGTVMPGRVGDEYYLTKGHLHAWRDAAEIYIGLSGEGVMLLEHERTGESRMVPLRPHTMVYVPGHTAHRTCNVGSTPLRYLGIYPARAGHDYGPIGRRNFRKVVAAGPDGPILVDRSALTAQWEQRHE